MKKNPIPESAKLVFKGKIFEVYQWEQELYDGSTAIFEKLKRPDTVGVIPVTEDGKIMLIHDEQPGRSSLLSLAGGRVEENEEPLEAAKRELLEETGYNAGEWILLTEVAPVAKMDWTIYTFVAKRAKKVSEPNLDPGEKIEVDIVSFEEFLDLVSQEDFYGFELTDYILRVRLDPEKMADLKKALFD